MGIPNIRSLPPEMPRVAGGGVSAYSNAFALAEHETWADQLEFWFLSLLGPQQSVKSLWAQLIKGQLMTIAWDEAHQTRMARLAPLGKDGWHRALLALPSAAAYQLVLVPDQALAASDDAGFLLLPRQPEDAPRTYWRRLNRGTDLPLAPGWADWLWQRALALGEAAPLAARGLCAYRCRTDLARLAADVGNAVRVGVLTASEEGVEACV